MFLWEEAGFWRYPCVLHRPHYIAFWSEQSDISAGWFFVLFFSWNTLVITTYPILSDTWYFDEVVLYICCLSCLPCLLTGYSPKNSLCCVLFTVTCYICAFGLTHPTTAVCTDIHIVWDDQSAVLCTLLSAWPQTPSSSAVKY